MPLDAVAGRRRGAARDGRRLGRSRPHELSSSPAAATSRERRPTRARSSSTQDGTGLAARRRLRRRPTNPREPDSGSRRSRPRAGSITAAPRRPRRRPPSPPRPARRPAGAVRLAIGGHRRAWTAATGGSGQGYAPTSISGGDRPRQGDGRGRRRPGGAAVRRRARLARRRAARRGRRAPLPRADPGRGRADVRPARARRHRRAAATRRSRAAFADAAAPQGTGAAPEGVDAAAVAAARERRRAPGASSRSTCAPRRARCASSRSTTPSGSLAGGPDGPQAAVAARRHGRTRASRGIPWSWSAAPRWTARSAMPRADDADRELALLAGHASAYVATAGVDDPADPHFGGVLSRTEVTSAGAGAPLAVCPVIDARLRASAVDRRVRRTSFDESEVHPPDQRGAADARRRASAASTPAPGVAPVTAMSEPLVEDVALDASQRTFPVGFAQPIGVTGYRPRAAAVPVAATRRAARWSRRARTPASSCRCDQCVLWSATCTSTVPTDIAFALVEPAGRAVRRRPPRGRLGRSTPARDRPRRERARRRRPARRLLPADGGRRRRDRDDVGPSHHHADPGHRASRCWTCRARSRSRRSRPARAASPTSP